MQSDAILRDQLVYLLNGGGAHVPLQDEVRGFPYESAGTRIERVPHTAWQLLEHIRLCQWDILEFSRDANHVSPDFPDGYWPSAEAPEDRKAWERSVRQVLDDLQQMIDLVKNPGTDLFATIPHGDGQTVLREALLVADHNAYHLGQLVQIRRMLGGE